MWSTHLSTGDAAADAATAAHLEDLGYSVLWCGNAWSDGMTTFEVLLAATSHVTIGAGVLNIWFNDPADVATRWSEWPDAWRRRFVLGLGVGHAPQIDQGRPGRWSKPVHRMRDYLVALEAGGVPRQRRMLAALGPRMMDLAREMSAGAHPYFVTPDHTAWARSVLGPDLHLAPEQAVVLTADAATARGLAKAHVAGRMKLPNYHANLRRMGFDDADLAGHGSDRLIDALVAWGTVDAIGRRVQQHRDAGADHVCLQVVTDGTVPPHEQWALLAALCADDGP